MTDAFISYKREERELVEHVAHGLEDLGFEVWFDASLTAGESFSDEINRVARSSSVNLVCWSPNAIASRWVKAEALIGFERDTLAAAYVAGPDGFSPPTPFNAVHTVDLRSWVASPTQDDPEWKSLLRRIGEACGRPDVAAWGGLSVRSSAADVRAWLNAYGGYSPLLPDVHALADRVLAREKEKAESLAAARERHARETDPHGDGASGKSASRADDDTTREEQELAARRAEERAEQERQALEAAINRDAASSPEQSAAPSEARPAFRSTGSGTVRDANWLRGLLEQDRMGGARWIAVFVCTLAFAVSGVGLNSLGFGITGMIEEFGLSATQFGLANGATTLASIVAAFAFAPLADILGRRRILIPALIGAAVSLIFTSFAVSYSLVLVGRVGTGLAYGAVAGPLLATAGEWASRQARGFAVAIMVMGVSAGTALAAPIAVYFGWRFAFLVPGVCAAATVVLVYLLVPESIPFLLSTRKAGALERINRALHRLGHPDLETLPVATPAELRARGPAQVFAPHYLFRTIVLAIGLLATASTFSLAQTLIPAIFFGELGFTADATSRSVGLTIIGSILGALLMGLLSARRDPRVLGVYALALSAAGLAAFALLGGSSGTGAWLLPTIISFSLNAAIISFYIRLASSDPAFVRATSASAALGVSFFGSFIGPTTGGVLLDTFGYSVAFFAAAVLMIVLAIAMGLVRPSEREHAPSKA